MVRTPFFYWNSYGKTSQATSQRCWITESLKKSALSKQFVKRKYNF